RVGGLRSRHPPRRRDRRVQHHHDRRSVAAATRDRRLRDRFHRDGESPPQRPDDRIQAPDRLEQRQLARPPLSRNHADTMWNEEHEELSRQAKQENEFFVLFGSLRVLVVPAQAMAARDSYQLSKSLNARVSRTGRVTVSATTSDVL